MNSCKPVSPVLQLWERNYIRWYENSAPPANRINIANMYLLLCWDHMCLIPVHDLCYYLHCRQSCLHA